MIRTIALAAVLVSAACEAPQAQVSSSPASASAFASEQQRQWRLPGPLREISGLTVTADGRLFGHNDESAVIFQIDTAEGRIVKRFALGDPAIAGDFEDIAVTPSGDFYLVTSAGQLHRFREGADGAHVAYDVIDSGLREICEVEGLAYSAAQQSLILACKTNHADDMKRVVALYSWPIAGGRPAQLWRRLDEGEIAAAVGERKFSPSAVALDPQSGRTLIVAGPQSALIELDGEGRLVAARRLNGHRQPEGLAIVNGALLIADEGGGRGEALLTRYARAP